MVPQRVAAPGRVDLGLPVEERAYHEFWRTPWTLPWRQIVAVVLGLVGVFAVGFLLAIPFAIIDPELMGNLTAGIMTPSAFLMNNLMLASLIPISLLLNKWPMRQPAGFISSVVGRLRWRWLLTCVVVVIPLWALQLGIELFFGASDLGLSWRPHTTAMIIIILTTQVFQCAGEEYAVRGVVFRAAGSLIPHELIGFLAGAVVSSLVFMLLHGAGDLWLNIFYLTFGACSALLTWRTGGLEAAIAVHCVNNMFSLALVPFVDMGGIFARESGVGGPSILLNITVLVVATVLLLWLAKRKSLVTKTAPGRGNLPPMYPQPTAGLPGPYQVPQQFPYSPGQTQGWPYPAQQPPPQAPPYPGQSPQGWPDQGQQPPAPTWPPQAPGQSQASDYGRGPG